MQYGQIIFTFLTVPGVGQIVGVGVPGGYVGVGVGFGVFVGVNFGVGVDDGFGLEVGGVHCPTLP